MQRFQVVSRIKPLAKQVDVLPRCSPRPCSPREAAFVSCAFHVYNTGYGMTATIYSRLETSCRVWLLDQLGLPITPLQNQYSFRALSSIICPPPPLAMPS